MKEEPLLLLSDLQKLINQVVLIDYTIIILGGCFLMLSCTYEVVAIDGDYAHLRRNDIEPEDNEMKLVARALLPPEIMEGSILKYEMLQYEIIG